LGMRVRNTPKNNSSTWTLLNSSGCRVLTRVGSTVRNISRVSALGPRKQTDYNVYIYIYIYIHIRARKCHNSMLYKYVYALFIISLPKTSFSRFRLIVLFLCNSKIVIRR
jgi:hypothetical protein